MTFSYYIDAELKSYEAYLLSTFEAMNKLLQYGNFRFYFSKSKKSHELLSNLRENIAIINLIETNKLESFILSYESSTIPFSWGIEDFQYIFIIFDKGDEYLLQTPVALIGLMLHELMHGVERIRGLEDDLNSNMKFTQEFFTGFMELLPKYSKKELEKTLINIAQTSIFVLKEWFCNRELIERDYTSELLFYYEAMFGLNESVKTEKLPVLEITLPEHPEAGKVNLEDFSQALSFFLALTSAYIPFLRMHTSSYAHTTAEKIRTFLYTRYPNLQSVARELKHLEDLYLTEFSYTKKFHQAFYTEIFSLVYRYLGGKTFLIWHYVDIVENIENLPDFSAPESNENLIGIVLVPILKAASIFCKNIKIPKELEEGLQKKMILFIDKEELTEWNESWHEYDINKLLLLPLQHLIEKLREKFLESIQELRVYTKVILKILNLLGGEEYEESCREWREMILKFISERDSRFSGLKILLPLEYSIKGVLFNDPFEMTSKESNETLFLFRYYAIPKTNYILKILMKVARLIKFTMSKIDLDEPEESGQAIAMTVSMFLAAGEEFTDLTYAHIIFKLLLEILQVPVNISRIASKTFRGLLQSQENGEEEGSLGEN